MALAPGLTREELEAFAEAEARRQGVPPQLVKAIIDTESNWEPGARSERDARGLMQLRHAAAAEVGVRDRNDPIQNIRGGVAYLKKQLNRFGDTGLALAAYNWGPKNAAQLEANPRGTRIPQETLKYVPEVFARMRRYGEMLAPSSLTIGLYPGIKDVLADETLTSVRGKLGLEPRRAIERSIQTGNTPRPAPRPVGPSTAAPAPETMAAAPGAPASGMSGAVLPGAPPRVPQPPPMGTPESEIVSSEGAPSAEGVPPGRQLVPQQRGRSVQTYLRQQYGPLADLADPFPSAFDAELERMIDRA